MRYLALLFLLTACGESTTKPSPIVPVVPLVPKTWFTFGDSLSDTRPGIFQYPEELQTLFPQKYILSLKGVGGNTTWNLRQRVQADIIDHTPEVVTILIGINDVKLFCEVHPAAVPVEDYEDNYRHILQTLKDSLPNTRIVLLTPFVLYEAGYTYPNPALVSLLPCIANEIGSYQQVVRQMGVEFGLEVIETQAMFDIERQSTETGLLSPDGIHLSTFGNKKLADLIALRF